MIQNLFTGIDLVEVQRFSGLSPSIRKRFFKRVFTPTERQTIGDHLERAAGFFAAKEAISKALGCGIGPIKWQEIEVVKDDLGKPQVKFSGEALAISHKIGISEWSLSISHTRQHAIAMVIGLKNE